MVNLIGEGSPWKDTDDDPKATCRHVRLSSNMGLEQWQIKEYKQTKAIIVTATYHLSIALLS